MSADPESDVSVCAVAAYEDILSSTHAASSLGKGEIGGQKIASLYRTKMPEVDYLQSQRDIRFLEPTEYELYVLMFTYKWASITQSANIYIYISEQCHTTLRTSILAFEKQDAYPQGTE